MIARRLPIVLPANHVALALLTWLTDKKAASAGNPFLCVDLPVSLPLVANDNTLRVVIVAILATGWWYLIGRLGLSSRQGKISRARSSAAAAVVLLICAFNFTLMADEFTRISREPTFSAVDAAIYVLAVALLAGGVMSAAIAIISGLRPN
jgi:hypothetical protein